MNVTGFYSPAHKSLWSIKTYTERQLEKVMIDVESTTPGEGYTLPFGILDGASREHNYMQAIDKFDIGSYSNEELTSK